MRCADGESWPRACWPGWKQARRPGQSRRLLEPLRPLACMREPGQPGGSIRLTPEQQPSMRPHQFKPSLGLHALSRLPPLPPLHPRRHLLRDAARVEARGHLPLREHLPWRAGCMLTA